MEVRKENKLLKVCFYTSEHFLTIINGLAAKYEMPKSRVISWIIDNAVEARIPFQYDLTLPSEGEYIPNAYADECGKFMDYMKKLEVGMGLDMLMLLRHDIGIPDREILLHVFKECLDLGLIHPVRPNKVIGRGKFPESYKYYRATGTKGRETKLKRSNKEKRYKQYLKLQKEFKNE